MKLYHYASTPYSKLLTRRKQGVEKEILVNAIAHAKRLGDPGPYTDHISLFIEQPPLNTIASIFKYQHPFWSKGNKIYEHVVDSKDLEPNLLYQLVETPEMDKFTDQFDWAVKDKVIRTQYFLQLNEEMKRLNFTGFGANTMVKKLTPYLGKSESFYILARLKEDAEQTAKQYAAYVPHLMVYPKSGEIKIESIRTVILGGAKYNTTISDTKSLQW